MRSTVLNTTCAGIYASVRSMTQSYFARKASGLVREFGWFDFFVMAGGMCGASFFSFSSQIAFVATVIPGADVTLSSVLGFLFCIPLGIAYYVLSVSMPRSGGDYVWTSRLIHPAVGFMSGWGFWFALQFMIAICVWLVPVVGLSQMLVTLGYAFANPGLVELAGIITGSNLNVFMIAFACLLFAYVVSGLGARTMRWAVIVTWFASTIGTIAVMFVLATSSHSDYVSALTGFGGTDLSFNSIMDQARVAGWSYAPVTMGMTVLSVPIGVLLYNGFTYVSGASGEIRSPKRGMLGGMIGMLVFAAIINVIGCYLAVSVIGDDFLQATMYLSTSGKWAFNAPPWVALLVSPLIRNNVLLFIVQISPVMLLLAGCTSQAMILTRYVFAFSFDRVFPTALSDLSGRFHFPVKSSIFNFVISAIFVVVISFTSLMGMFMNSMAILSLVWFFVGLALVMLPFSKYKDLVKTLPGATWRVPPASIIGAITMILMAVTWYWSVTIPAVGGATNLGAQILLISVFMAGLLVYAIAYFYNKSRGIEMSRLYAEIPPE